MTHRGGQNNTAAGPATSGHIAQRSAQPSPLPRLGASRWRRHILSHLTSHWTYADIASSWERHVGNVTHCVSMDALGSVSRWVRQELGHTECVKEKIRHAGCVNSDFVHDVSDARHANVTLADHEPAFDIDVGVNVFALHLASSESMCAA